MKIKAESLEDWHVNDILPRLQEKQRNLSADYHAALMRRAGPAGAFLVDGVVMALAGLIDFPGTDRCVVWCLYAEDVKVPFVALHRLMMKCMWKFPRRRYEAYVDPTWKAAKRLVKLEGFKYEGTMEAFEADGTDRELWALINKVGA